MGRDGLQPWPGVHLYRVPESGVVIAGEERPLQREIRRNQHS